MSIKSEKGHGDDLEILQCEYDLRRGESIPVSLPRWTRYDDFRANLAKTIGGEYSPTDRPDRDGETIEMAVQLGRSSTGKAYHGKGLPVIRDIIDNCAGGTVRIISRNGEYSCTAGQQPTHTSRPVARMTPTLIIEDGGELRVQSIFDHDEPSRDHPALSGDEPIRAGVFRLRPRQATPHRVFVINWAGLLPRRKYR